MSDLQICRICLCKGVKVYNYDDYHLKEYYGQILAQKVVLQYISLAHCAHLSPLLDIIVS